MWPRVMYKRRHRATFRLAPARRRSRSFAGSGTGGREKPQRQRPSLSRLSRSEKCSVNDLNPFEYLKDLFTRLPEAKITEIKQFTPRAWAVSSQTRPAQAA